MALTLDTATLAAYTAAATADARAQANVKGATSAGIVDANLNLQGSYRTQYLGTHGHEIP